MAIVNKVQKYIFLKNNYEVLNWCNGFPSYYQFINKVKNVKKMFANLKYSITEMSDWDAFTHY